MFTADKNVTSPQVKKINAHDGRSWSKYKLLWPLVHLFHSAMFTLAPQAGRLKVPSRRNIPEISAGTNRTITEKMLSFFSSQRFWCVALWHKNRKRVLFLLSAEFYTSADGRKTSFSFAYGTEILPLRCLAVSIVCWRTVCTAVIKDRALLSSTINILFHIWSVGSHMRCQCKYNFLAVLPIYPGICEDNKPTHLPKLQTLLVVALWLPPQPPEKSSHLMQKQATDGKPASNPPPVAELCSPRRGKAPV